ncbi:hypothetical protein DBQ26_11235 [Acinetobacter pittii]|uniref:hypothetical protein n=1 Tax=Acinetobacter pittii TaxID=48296 RepID=UPI000D216FE2|nr:hypothetical protein [Acinetobacter pittii]AVZ05150.1 hypothetical protein DBQ26_11235 [Acinetobacter pittii]
MTDLNKERELYESVIEKTQDLKMVHLVGISFNQEKNQYEVPGEKWASELTDACLELNTGWFIWQECVKAKAQAVPENHIVVPRTREVVVAIEKIVQQQCDASGVQEPLHRLDGWRILEEIAEKVEEIK